MMSSRFYFSAIGTRDEVLGQLKHVANVEGIPFAEEIRNTLLSGISSQPGYLRMNTEDRYSINVNGSAGDQETPLTLSVTVQSRYMPKADQA